MKTFQIASSGQHHTMARVPETPEILSTVASQLRSEFGHGVSWRSGAAYLTLRDFSTVAVPNRLLKSALKKYGAYVLSVR